MAPAKKARNDSMHGSVTIAKSPQQSAIQCNYLPNQNKVVREQGTSFPTTSATNFIINEANRDLVTASLLDCDLDEDIAIESQRSAGNPTLPGVCTERFIGDQSKGAYSELEDLSLSSDLVEESAVQEENEVGLFDDLDDENGDHSEAIDLDAVQPADRPSTSGVRRADSSRGEKRRSGSLGGRNEKRRVVSNEISSSESSAISSSESSECSSVSRSSESSDFEVDTETDDPVRSEYWLRSKAAEERPNEDEDEGQSGRSSKSDLQDEAIDVLNAPRMYRIRSEETEIQIIMIKNAEQKSDWAAACKKLFDRLIRKITNEIH